MSLSDRGLFEIDALSDVQGGQGFDIVRSFWPTIRIDNTADYSPLFEFVAETLRQLRPDRDDFAAKRFKDLFDIVKCLQDHQAATKAEIVTRLKSSTFPTGSDDQIKKSMELTVRLWLGLNVQFSGRFVGKVYPHQKYLDWKANESLTAMTMSHFTATTVGQMLEETDLNGLSATSLKTLRLMQIEWTNCLSDHLNLVGKRGQRTLYLYQQKGALANHRTAGSPIPSEILDETLRSIELLLPTGDPSTRDFLEKSEKSWLLQPSSVSGSASFSLNDFAYWQPRLKRLLAFLNSPPESVLQRLFDTRDIGQWAGLWVGVFGILVLTLLFGILATVYGIKQYNLALEAYDVSVQSFRLSLLLACQQNATALGAICDTEIKVFR